MCLCARPACFKAITAAIAAIKDTSSPADWWDVNADLALIAGIYRHGYGSYEAVRLDPTFAWAFKDGGKTEKEREGGAGKGEEGREVPKEQQREHQREEKEKSKSVRASIAAWFREVHQVGGFIVRGKKSGAVDLEKGEEEEHKQALAIAEKVAAAKAAAIGAAAAATGGGSGGEGGEAAAVVRKKEDEE